MYCTISSFELHFPTVVISASLCFRNAFNLPVKRAPWKGRRKERKKIKKKEIQTKKSKKEEKRKNKPRP